MARNSGGTRQAQTRASSGSQAESQTPATEAGAGDEARVEEPTSADQQGSGENDPADQEHPETDSMEQDRDDGPDPEQVEAGMRELLRVAEGRVANVLYPKPDSMSAEDYGSALAGLVERGLAHDGSKPNLTVDGREVARELIAED